MTLAEEWVWVLDAATLIARRFGGLTYAKEAIALGLREGLLQARADHVTFCDPEYEEDGEEGTVFDCEASDDEPIQVPPEMWSRSANWDRDRAGWDWANGEFEIEGHSSERLEYSYGGLSLLQSEVDAISPDVVPYDTVSQRKKNIQDKVEERRERSVSPKYWEWEPAFADLVAIADFDGLSEAFGKDLQLRGGMTKLEEWFESWFRNNRKSRVEGATRDAPSEAECRKRAKMIVQALITRGNVTT